MTFIAVIYEWAVTLHHSHINTLKQFIEIQCINGCKNWKIFKGKLFRASYVAQNIVLGHLVYLYFTMKRWGSVGT